MIEATQIGNCMQRCPCKTVVCQQQQGEQGLQRSHYLHIGLKPVSTLCGRLPSEAALILKPSA